jgi:hypothetical protein
LRNSHIMGGRFLVWEHPVRYSTFINMITSIYKSGTWNSLFLPSEWISEFIYFPAIFLLFPDFYIPGFIKLMFLRKNGLVDVYVLKSVNNCFRYFRIYKSFRNDVYVNRGEELLQVAFIDIITIQDVLYYLFSSRHSSSMGNKSMLSRQEVVFHIRVEKVIKHV